ncbi:hypothetical protein Peur_044416 [Populus x canadensis]
MIISRSSRRRFCNKFTLYPSPLNGSNMIHVHHTLFFPLNSPACSKIEVENNTRKFIDKDASSTRTAATQSHSKKISMTGKKNPP